MVSPPSLCSINLSSAWFTLIDTTLSMSVSLTNIISLISSILSLNDSGVYYNGYDMPMILFSIPNYKCGTRVSKDDNNVRREKVNFFLTVNKISSIRSIVTFSLNFRSSGQLKMKFMSNSLRIFKDKRTGGTYLFVRPGETVLGQFIREVPVTQVLPVSQIFPDLLIGQWDRHKSLVSSESKLYFITIRLVNCAYKIVSLKNGWTHSGDNWRRWCETECLHGDTRRTWSQ